MALQTSGAISLLDIQNEFGGSNPISLSEYYGAASGIPASGAISIGNFYGASAGWILTQGSAGTAYGFSSGAYGSISPTTLNGAEIRDVYYGAVTIKNNTSHFFYVYLAGNRAQSFFTSVSEAGLGTKTTASADGSSYASSTNETYWIWILSGPPSGWDGSGNLTVTFV
jgi:hypothetical protein